MHIHHEIIKPDYTIRYLQKVRPMDHWHQRIELLLVDAGSFLVTVQGQTYEGGVGDVFVIRSGAIHRIQSGEAGGSFYVCTFSPALLYTLQAEIPSLQCHISKDALVQAGLWTEVCRHFAQMLQEREEKYAEVSIPARIQLLFSLLARNFEAPFNGSTMENYPELQKILSYISNNFRENVSLGDVARKLNYSASYVSSLFLSCTGLNFKAYLDNIRIQEATRLLLESNDSVSKICTCCGFDNIRTFNNVFRRVTGTTPTQFRKGG